MSCDDRNRPNGVIGIELHNRYGLLRSLAIEPQARNSGYGKILVNAIEQLAKSKNIHSIYLLTTTAELFFIKLGYNEIKRELTPEAIQKTTEFTTLCPDTATVMYKQLKKSF